MTFVTGGPIAGMLIACEMELGQSSLFQQRWTIKLLWIATSGVSLSLAFTLGMFISREVLIVGAITGLVYGLATVIPLKRLLQTSTPVALANDAA